MAGRDRRCDRCGFWGPGARLISLPGNGNGTIFQALRGMLVKAASSEKSWIGDKLSSLIAGAVPYWAAGALYVMEILRMVRGQRIGD